MAEGENVFGVCHIFASFNDTDLSGKEIICRVTGGMKVKADRDESSPYGAMLAAQDVAQRCKELSITALHIKLQATGENRTKTPGSGAQLALRALAGSDITSGRLRTSPPSPLTAPTVRGIAMVVICEQDFSKYFVNKLPSCKKKKPKISWAWWRMHVIPATQEAKAQELFEPRRQRLQSAEIVPLHW